MDKGTVIRKERSSNIELLRIIAACGVIARHYDNSLFLGSSKYFVFDMCDCWFAWVVTAFFMISGYFSYRRMELEWSKPIKLYIQLVFFRILEVLLATLRTGKTVPGDFLMSFVPLNYFFSLYIAVYLISPYLNRLFAALDPKQKRRGLLLAVGVFSIWAYAVDLLSVPLDTNLGMASPLSIAGNMSGYNVVNFSLCYLIGAAVGDGSLRIKKPLLCFAASTAAILLIRPYFSTYLASSFCSPFVLLQTASILCLFHSWDIGSIGWINRLAGACFTVYLSHSMLMRFVRPESIYDAPTVVMCANLLFSVAALYLAGFLLHEAYVFLTAPLFRAIWKTEKKESI